MTSSLPTITLILSVLALFGALYSIWQITSLNRLRKGFFAGSRGVDLQDVIESLQRELSDSRGHTEALEKILLELKDSSSFAVQKLGLVRFNPFNDGGGNFSFSLALLDAHNTGVIFTSMYGREQNRIYTKKIDNGKCEIQLTEEEQQAIAIANSKNQETRTKQIPNLKNEV
jgi:hypothetical protein